MATVFVPAAMRKLTAGRERVTAHGRTIGRLIDDLERQFPGFRDYLVEGGELKPAIAVSIDGEIANGGLLEQVQHSSEVYFLPALGGGAGLPETVKTAPVSVAKGIASRLELRTIRAPAGVCPPFPG